jgi:hypothetical protein
MTAARGLYEIQPTRRNYFWFLRRRLGRFPKNRIIGTQNKQSVSIFTYELLSTITGAARAASDGNNRIGI